MATPDLIGRYRVGTRAGTGGFAVVWLAQDDSLDTPIAIKVMAEHWADRMDLRERFLGEARMLRQASSTRVVQVFDIGELPDGRPYFVMEYADRGTLADRIGTGPLPLAQALHLTAEVARGVAELHRAGIVHRDIKPSNVLIASAPGGAERVLIADLGVAKDLAQGSGLTMSVGSAGYMAPEQAAPNRGVDVRADVYSVGAVAYRLITGVVPGTPGQVTASDRLVPGLPGKVTKVLQRAMEPDRERRWPDAASLATRLDQLSTEVTHARARTRRRISLVTVVFLLVALLSGGGVAVWNSSRTVAVADAQGHIGLRVPRAWGAQLTADGWDPGVLGLTPAAAGALSAGLIVASDMSRWSDPASRVDGAFAGLSTDAQLPRAVPAITHPGCRDGGILQYDGKRFTGAVHRWTACPGGGSFGEAGLIAGTGGRRAYVQFRSSASAGPSPGQIRAVLDSLRASG